MSTYSFNENDLNFFQKAVCLKSVSFEEASLSSVGTVTKILIIFVLIVVIVTCILNIVSNFEILNKPEELRDISKSYCIALLVFNFIVLILSLLLAFFIIKAFWTDARNKKAVKNALLKAKLEGAEVGAKIGVKEAFKYVSDPISTVIAESAMDAVKQYKGAPEDEDIVTLGKLIVKTVDDEIQKNIREIQDSSIQIAENYIEVKASSSGVSFGVPEPVERAVGFGSAQKATNPVVVSGPDAQLLTAQKIASSGANAKLLVAQRNATSGANKPRTLRFAAPGLGPRTDYNPGSGR